MKYELTTIVCPDRTSWEAILCPGRGLGVCCTNCSCCAPGFSGPSAVVLVPLGFQRRSMPQLLESHWCVGLYVLFMYLCIYLFIYIYLYLFIYLYIYDTHMIQYIIYTYIYVLYIELHR